MLTFGGGIGGEYWSCESSLTGTHSYAQVCCLNGWYVIETIATEADYMIHSLHVKNGCGYSCSS